MEQPGRHFFECVFLGQKSPGLCTNHAIWITSLTQLGQCWWRTLIAGENDDNCGGSKYFLVREMHCWVHNRDTGQLTGLGYASGFVMRVLFSRCRHFAFDCFIWYFCRQKCVLLNKYMFRRYRTELLLTRTSFIT